MSACSDSVNVEPSFVALGPQHVAVGMNIRIWLYRYGDRQQQQVQLRQALLAEPERGFQATSRQFG